MKFRHLLFSAAAIFAIANAASALELKPLHGQSINLGAVSGTAYYTVERNGYRVVATLAREGVDASPMRIETVLKPGQSVSLSTPREWGAAGATFEIQRIDDAVLVQRGPATH